MDLFQFDQVTIWVDGSFVTHKRTPNDLDIVVFIDSDRIDQKHDLFQSQLSHEHLQTIYRIDAYWVKVYPESHPFYHHTLADKAYWLNLFTRTYRNRQGVSFKKGFLDITVLSHEI
jgi:hypothetical protein